MVSRDWCHTRLESLQTACLLGRARILRKLGHIRSRATPAKHSEAVFYEDNKKVIIIIIIIIILIIMIENIKKVSERATVTEIQKICMLRSARILRKMLNV